MRFARQIVTTGLRSFTSQATSSQSSGSVPPSDPLSLVKGLSQKIVAVPSNQQVGPGAKSDGAYKVPEYYSYNTMSYYEAEIEMAKFRLPQPDAGKQQ